MKARHAASIVLAAGLLLGSTGCSLLAVQGTLRHYEPSDGVGANIGDVKVRDLLGLSADGKDVALVFTLVNAGKEGATVGFQYQDAAGDKHTQFVFADPNASVSIGNVSDSQLVLRGVDVQVGGLISVYVQYGDAEGKELLVPVLDGSLAPYGDLLPSPAPTPTESATPSPTPST